MSFNTDKDFLDEIFMAEEKQYSDAYRNAFAMIADDKSASQLSDRSGELESSWVHGLQYGATLGSELYSYQGLAEEVLASWSVEEHLDRHHPVTIAKKLIELLNESPGPLARSCEEFAKHPSLDGDLALIRNKAKMLISKLEIHSLSKGVEGLDF
ncbi:unnamed protein product [Rodentolepis nana]|uniref:Yae1_N domain-containing protein n=1 Tax=Rodentolepis nana TaxID=102285 RepID=A0A0R3TUY0_RODNA|nr:unnamed protein product [Rodentolepis nana]